MKGKHSQTHRDYPRGNYLCVTPIQTSPCGLSDTNWKTCIYMKTHTYTEKNKDTETKIEIPTPTPAASVRYTLNNSRCEERTFTPSVMKLRQEVTVWWVWARRPPHWRTCRYGRSTPGPKRPAIHELRLDKELHVQSDVLFMYYRYKYLPFVTVSSDYPLGGVTVTYRDPT